MLFIAFVIAGTLLHECGHYAVAKWYGHSGGSIHYKYTYFGTPTDAWYHNLTAIYDKYEYQIDNDLPFADSVQYEHAAQLYQKRSFWITVGGPLQTLTTGTIGLGLLIAYRKRYKQAAVLRPWQWLVIMVSLFWLRPLVNCLMHFSLGLFTGKWFGGGDEVKIAKSLGWPRASIEVLTAIIAVIILAVIVFRYVAASQRFTFMCAAVLGGGASFIIWMYWLGPVVLP